MISPQIGIPNQTISCNNSLFDPITPSMFVKKNTYQRSCRYKPIFNKPSKSFNKAPPKMEHLRDNDILPEKYSITNFNLIFKSNNPLENSHLK